MLSTRKSIAGITTTYCGTISVIKFNPKENNLSIRQGFTIQDNQFLGVINSHFHDDSIQFLKESFSDVEFSLVKKKEYPFLILYKVELNK